MYLCIIECQYLICLFLHVTLDVIVGLRKVVLHAKKLVLTVLKDSVESFPGLGNGSIWGIN